MMESEVFIQGEVRYNMYVPLAQQICAGIRKKIARACQTTLWEWYQVFVVPTLQPESKT